MRNKRIKEKLVILIKKYLITGLVVVIPLWLTYFIMTVLFKCIGSLAFPVISYYVTDTYWVRVLAKISSFFISIMCILVLGFITNRVFGRDVLNFIEKLIEKLPILGTVHSATKQFVSFIFGTDTERSFKQVIFVHYPNKDVYSVAFFTGRQMVNNENYVCVFMPTTPNPTTGFLLLFNEKDIIYTNYTVEQAFQFVISVGVIAMKDSKKIEFKEEIEEIKEVKK
ncbi:MAG: DUF502 domain-containing protein [Endomicrobium sp.]|jgi:uncharacterized membrane protein|nr:DUF502 domain-containing protein [Endomicrobium sp.]